jgi:hypothetical protein
MFCKKGRSAMTDVTKLDSSQPTAQATPPDGSDVPESERGKAENMPLERRTPSLVFGIVGLTYWLILIAVLAVGGFVWWLWGG